jgi:LysM repeat protein
MPKHCSASCTEENAADFGIFLFGFVRLSAFGAHALPGFQNLTYAATVGGGTLNFERPGPCARLEGMLRLRAIGPCAVLFLLMCCAGGCFQAENHPDEETDPHFQKGRSLADGQDFKGAAQEFEKALETNPHSAAAHFELGWLYDTKLNDYAAAIYHYERHLQFQPDSVRAALVRERIRGCKQELANSEFPLPNSRDLQRDVDRLNTENQLLKKQLEALKNQPAAVAVLAQGRVEPVRYTVAAAVVPRPEAPRATAPPAAPPAVARPRVHVVKAHETFTSIATKYGVATSAVMAANPRTDPRHLRVGQSLNLP